MYKVFVDGQEGTTGLQIRERLAKQTGIEVLEIPTEKRKDTEVRRELLNQSDISFLCLPDAAARESASLVTDKHTRLIDASTAHRTDPDWTYGLPELNKNQRSRIRDASRVANPGCHATGFNLLMFPLVTDGIVPSDYPVTCHSVTGYSGGGKKLIAMYEAAEGSTEHLAAPRHYGLTLTHKHLPEMQKMSGLDSPPLFTPIVGAIYKGMGVFVPLHRRLLCKQLTAAEICEHLSAYYAEEAFVEVYPYDPAARADNGFFNPMAANDTNKNDIFVFGHDDQILLVSRLDNLGKGASGAAVQNMNIMLGMDEGLGLR